MSSFYRWSRLRRKWVLANWYDDPRPSMSFLQFVGLIALLALVDGGMIWWVTR